MSDAALGAGAAAGKVNCTVNTRVVCFDASLMTSVLTNKVLDAY